MLGPQARVSWDDDVFESVRLCGSAGRETLFGTSLHGRVGLDGLCGGDGRA